MTTPALHGAVSQVARNETEWMILSRAASTPFVRSLAEFDALMSDREGDSGPLAGLSAEAVDKFRQELRFVEVSVNGQPYRRYLAGFYFGDLVQSEGFDDARLEAVAAMFGIGAELFSGLRDYFGDFGPNEEIICRRRPYYFCGRYPR